MQTNRSVLWLVVEDSADDFLLLQRACAHLSSPPVLRRLDNGVHAQGYLNREQENWLTDLDAQPALVISDLNMPCMNGLELLAWFKGQPHLRRIPFVLMTDSTSPRDRHRARHLGADGFVVKPSEFIELIRTVQQVAERHGAYARTG
jgi:two-component system, chemotaxis family, response regulator Rcp1